MSKELALLTEQSNQIITPASEVSDIDVSFYDFRHEEEAKYNTVTVSLVDKKFLDLKFNNKTFNEDQLLIEGSAKPEKSTQMVITPTQKAHQVELVLNELNINLGAENRQNLPKLLEIEEHTRRLIMDNFHSSEKYIFYNDGKSIQLSITSGTDPLAASKEFNYLNSVEKIIDEEFATIFHDKIYETFPILRNSTSLAKLNDNTITTEEALLSRVYSADPVTARSVINKLINSGAASTVIAKDVLAFLSLNIAKGANYPNLSQSYFHVASPELVDYAQSNYGVDVRGAVFNVNRNETFKIILDQNVNRYIQYGDFDIDGVYKPEFNVAVATNNENMLMHELTHAVLQLIFKNNTNPYFKNSEESINFELAKNTFIYNLNLVMQNGKNVSAEDSFADLYSATKNILLMKLLAIGPKDIDVINSFESLKVAFFGDKASKYTITTDNINDIIRAEADELNLSDCELEFLSSINSVFFKYDISSVDSELLPFAAHLTYENYGKCNIENLVKPVTEYWKNFVAPHIEYGLTLPHEIECSGTNIDNPTFEHCVEGYY